MTLILYYLKGLLPIILSAFSLNILNEYSPSFCIEPHTESWYIFWGVLSLVYGRAIDILIEGWLHE